MGCGNESRKQSIVGSLCQHLSIDPKIWLDATADNDAKSLCSKILKVGENEGLLKNNDEIMKWIAFAEGFPVDFEARIKVTSGLNDDLASKSVLCGDGLKPSAADIVVFSVLHSFLISLSNSDRQKFPHVLRWMDYVQNKEDLGKIFEKLSLEKATFEPYVCKSEPKVAVDSNVKNIAPTKKDVDDVAGNQKSEKTAAAKKVSGETKAAEESKKLPEKKEVIEKDKDFSDVSVSLLKIQVGLIRKAWKHPSADSLLVEEIDVGDAKLRQVVSGLAKFFSPEQLMNRRVVLITNVKPGKLRDVMSEGLVLCASNEDHSVVEPLLPPEGAKLGERILFPGHDGKPEDVLNPKKKQLEKITPHLGTDVNGVAKFKGIPFMTTAGPCTCSIPKANVK